jgi:hypothetical protein
VSLVQQGKRPAATAAPTNKQKKRSKHKSKPEAVALANLLSAKEKYLKEKTNKTMGRTKERIVWTGLASQAYIRYY